MSEWIGGDNVQSISDSLEESQQGINQCLAKNICDEHTSMWSDQTTWCYSKPKGTGRTPSEVSLEEQPKASGSQQRKRRRVIRVVRISCTHCRQAKQACDDFRPCFRCVRLGLQSTCVDAPSSRPRRCSNPKSSFQDTNSSLLSQGEQLNTSCQRNYDRFEKTVTSSYQPSPRFLEEISCSSKYSSLSEKPKRERVVSLEPDFETLPLQNSKPNEKSSKLFIPVECLTKGKSIALDNFEDHIATISRAVGEASNSETWSYSIPHSSCKLYDDDETVGDCSLSFENGDSRTHSKNEHYAYQGNNSDLVYSLSMKEGLIFAAGKIWDVMFYWDQELQLNFANLNGEHVLDIAKSEMLFYFVAKSIDRYVHFFSSNIKDPPYQNLFVLNAAIQSLESASEEFAQTMFSLLPPKSPVISDDQHNLFLESIPIAALKMSVSLDDSWHKILYVNGECCDLFGTTRARLIELLSDPSSLHIIFVDNGWIAEPLKTLQSLRNGLLKRKSTFKLRSLRNEVLDCLVSTSFGTDSNWLPKYIIFYIQSIRKLEYTQNCENSTGTAESPLEEKEHYFHSAASTHTGCLFEKSLSCWNSTNDESPPLSYPSRMAHSSTGNSQSSVEQHLYPHF